jgi:acetyl-CoA acetyltransferase
MSAPLHHPAVVEHHHLVHVGETVEIVRDQQVARLDLPPERTNPHGSGISLGHPIGATGAILVVKALYERHRTGGRYGLVTMCIGGGQGIAAVFERA